MTEVKNYKFHSTGQFRNVVNNIQNANQFKGLDSDGNAVFDRSVIQPTLRFIGTVKLHGTNDSIVLHESGVVSFHSKSQLLGYIKDNEFTLNSDNACFAQSMYQYKKGVLEVVEYAKKASMDLFGEIRYPIKISGEWCGQGIQKGVGISFISRKSLFIFGVKFGETDQTNKRGWKHITKLSNIESPDFNIYNIANFKTYEVDIDFNNPVMSQNKLVEITEEVENECPVAKQLGVTESLLGEGLVWTPIDEDYAWDSGNWFKTKGKKHSVSKVKSVAAVDTEKLNSINEFVEYAVTDNRLEQGVNEVGLDIKKVGEFIGWVNRDVLKEESDTLNDNNLTMKDVGKYVANKARMFYINKVNSDM